MFRTRYSYQLDEVTRRIPRPFSLVGRAPSRRGVNKAYFRGIKCVVLRSVNGIVLVLFAVFIVDTS